MLEFKQLLSVIPENELDTYLCVIEVYNTETQENEQFEFLSRPSDPYGLGPIIRLAIQDWKNNEQ